MSDTDENEMTAPHQNDRHQHKSSFALWLISEFDGDQSMLSLEITFCQEHSRQDVHPCKHRCVLKCTHTFTLLRHSFSSHLKLGKLLSLVAGVLCIDELGEEELSELWALRKANMERDGRIMISGF